MANKNKNEKPGRGRPRKEIVLPKGNAFTIGDICAANEGNVKCRLTIYTRVGELVKDRVLKLSKETRPTGGVGKPANVYVTMASLKRSLAAKKAAKTLKSRKLATAAPVDMAPVDMAPAPLTEANTAPDAVPVNA